MHYAMFYLNRPKKNQPYSMKYYTYMCRQLKNIKNIGICKKNTHKLTFLFFPSRQKIILMAFLKRPSLFLLFKCAQLLFYPFAIL